MILASSPTLGQAPYWYLTRSTGLTAFVLLTIALAFGVAATQRALATPAWPRFATQTLHRNVSLLGVVFLVVHVITTIVDGYVTISWWSVIVPGASAYRPVWVALGTVASDLLLLVIVTSLVRLHMDARVWRRVHYAVYVLWPLSLLHFLNTGTDAAHGRFGVWIAGLCAAVVVVSVLVRVATKGSPPRPVSSVR